MLAKFKYIDTIGGYTMTQTEFIQACLNHLTELGISSLYASALVDMAIDNTHGEDFEQAFDEFKKLAPLTKDIHIDLGDTPW